MTTKASPTIRFDCPKCDATYRVPEEMGGRKARCQSCGAAFQLPPSVKRMLATVRRPGGGGAHLPAAKGTGTVAAAPASATSDAAVSPSGSDSHAADTAQSAPPETPSRRTDVISPTKRRTSKPAPQKKRASRKWNVLALAGAVLLLMSVFVPWLSTEVPGESIMTFAGVSPLRLAIDATVLEDAGALNPGGGTPIMMRLTLLLIPVLAFVVLFREWGTRSKGVHPQVTLAVAAIGSVVAVAVMVMVIGSQSWEISAEATLANSFDLASGIRGSVAVLRQQLAIGAVLWFAGTILMLFAVLKASRS